MCKVRHGRPGPAWWKEGGELLDCGPLWTETHQGLLMEKLWT